MTMDDRSFSSISPNQPALGCMLICAISWSILGGGAYWIWLTLP